MGPMLATGLEFAPGTTDDCKRLVGGLFKPGEILGAYRQAREHFKNGDLVLAVSKSDPSGFRIEPRIEYLKGLRKVLGSHAPRVLRALGLAHQSAHGVMRLPAESEAMWLVISRGQELPVMCVLFTTPYEVSAAAAN